MNHAAQVLGGKKRYETDKAHFESIRKIAWKNNRKRAKYEFDINQPLSEDLCELIGVIIGDGFTNTYRSGAYLTQITGDLRLDKEYWITIAAKFKELLGVEPKIRERESDHSIRINIYSKRLFEMLTIRFGISRGRKSRSVVIPSEILTAEKIFLNTTLKGMFNTDGGVGFDRRPAYRRPYPRINYVSASTMLIQQVSKILYDYIIPHSVHSRPSKNQMIQINGFKNTQIFLLEIGFSNPRHLQKLSGSI